MAVLLNITEAAVVVDLCRLLDVLQILEASEPVFEELTLVTGSIAFVQFLMTPASFAFGAWVLQ